MKKKSQSHTKITNQKYDHPHQKEEEDSLTFDILDDIEEEIIEEDPSDFSPKNSYSIDDPFFLAFSDDDDEEKELTSTLAHDDKPLSSPPNEQVNTMLFTPHFEKTKITDIDPDMGFQFEEVTNDETPSTVTEIADVTNILTQVQDETLTPTQFVYTYDQLQSNPTCHITLHTPTITDHSDKIPTTPTTPSQPIPTTQDEKKGASLLKLLLLASLLILILGWIVWKIF